MLKPQPPSRMTSAEFLVWAGENEVGHVELVNGEVVAMSGDTKRDNLTKKAIDRSFDDALQRVETPCVSYIGGIGVIVSDDTTYIPDVVVDCDESQNADDCAAGTPVIVVEVLPRTTGHIDRGEKVIGYFQVPGLHHYLLVDAERRNVLHHQRDGEEIRTRIVGSGSLDLTPPGISVQIEDFRRGLSTQEGRVT